MTEITQADTHIISMTVAAFKTSQEQSRMEDRAAIVAWLRSENGRCDCFAYEDNECACGGRDEYKTWPLEQTAERIEAGEYLK